MQLSPNFSLEELTRSDTALRKGIDNTPDAKQVYNLTVLCREVLQPARNALGGITVNSGYRSVALCNAVGSTSKSNHTRGTTADIESVRYSNFKLLEWIYENCEFKELIAEFFDRGDPKAGWVHVCYEDGNNRRTLKLKDKDHSYSRVTIDELRELYS